jgi:hypothetical protein
MHSQPPTKRPSSETEDVHQIMQDRGCTVPFRTGLRIKTRKLSVRYLASDNLQNNILHFSQKFVRLSILPYEADNCYRTIFQQAIIMSIVNSYIGCA